MFNYEGERERKETEDIPGDLVLGLDDNVNERLRGGSVLPWCRGCGSDVGGGGVSA